MSALDGDVVAASDRYVEQLRRGESPHADPLSAMFAAWRDETQED